MHVVRSLNGEDVSWPPRDLGARHKSEHRNGRTSLTRAGQQPLHGRTPPRGVSAWRRPPAPPPAAGKGKTRRPQFGLADASSHPGRAPSKVAGPQTNPRQSGSLRERRKWPSLGHAAHHPRGDAL
ncbi:uncharacterized protein Tco025E_00619 [Trypanosoma conorhini]|uniref:Uncharacterized protein n=1 Tax=Trypanosoma conorhini TaxID=83891 RepID=A0A3R7PLE1_9TRYP|nr:uncharacterized protein Tco025E_00619 [Trypanosoma conorhini]RNF27121.1 hypothetical protein Tco025E_00619 [Trypanosoma conorhini]